MLFDIDLVVVSIMSYLVLRGKWSHLIIWRICLSNKLTPPTWVQNMKSVWKCFQAEPPTCWIFTGPKHHRPDTCRHVLFWLHVFMSSMTFLGSGRSMCKCWCPYGAHLMTKHWKTQIIRSLHSHWRIKRWSPGYFSAVRIRWGRREKMICPPKSTITLPSNPWKESGVWYQDDTKEEAREEKIVHGLVWCFQNYTRLYMPLLKVYNTEVW